MGSRDANDLNVELGTLGVSSSDYSRLQGRADVLPACNWINSVPQADDEARRAKARLGRALPRRPFQNKYAKPTKTVCIWGAFTQRYSHWSSRL